MYDFERGNFCLEESITRSIQGMRTTTECMIECLNEMCAVMAYDQVSKACYLSGRYGSPIIEGSACTAQMVTYRRSK